MDAVQEAFVRIYRALPRFRGEAAFGTWAYGITLNVCRSRQSSKETRISRLSDPLESSRGGDGDPVALPLPDRGPLPDERALAGELRGAVVRALGALAPEHREIVVLREIEGLEYDEIGEALAIAPGTVKSRLSRARRALREALEGIWP